MKKLLMILILVSASSTNKSVLENDPSEINLLDDMTFEEFKVKLEKYADENPYPNIDD